MLKVPLIIEKTQGIKDKVQKYRGIIDNFPKLYEKIQYSKICFEMRVKSKLDKQKGTEEILFLRLYIKILIVPIY